MNEINNNQQQNITIHQQGNLSPQDLTYTFLYPVEDGQNRFYNIPNGYNCPIVTLWDGFNFWVKVQMISKDSTQWIRPF